MANFGNTTPGGTDFENMSSQSQVVWPIGQILDTGVLGSMTLDLDVADNGTPLTATAILMSGPDSGATAPNAIIATAQRTDLAQARAQFTFNAAGESLVSGTYLWLGLLVPTFSFQSIHVHLDGTLTAAQSRYDAGIVYPTPNSNPTNGTGNVRLLSGYITYTAAGGSVKYLRNKSLLLGVGA